MSNEVRDIEAVAAELAEWLPDARIAIGHGQMPKRELERVMNDFYHRQLNVLLCTTIIETGIDIPNANTIVIDRADRLGLAQLHQLRGRVGRSHRQAYWVCPLIDESESVRHQAAEETAAALAAALPRVRVGLVHGRMPGHRKDAVMGAFKNGRLDLLVATTVIEVGVDVPNASLMIIENAEAWASRSCTSCAAASAGARWRAPSCCSTPRRSRPSPASASACCATPTTDSRWRRE